MSDTRAMEMIFGLPEGSPIPPDEPPAALQSAQPAGQIPIETISVEEAAAIAGVDPDWLWEVVDEMMLKSRTTLSTRVVTPPTDKPPVES